LGKPDDEVERKTVKDYLEGMKGVGEIEVGSVEIAPTAPRPSSTSWAPESPTKKDVKSKRKPKV
jgi:hypothetical protein